LSALLSSEAWLINFASALGASTTFSLSGGYVGVLVVEGRGLTPPACTHYILGEVVSVK
jgi:hypothetical protein